MLTVATSAPFRPLSSGWPSPAVSCVCELCWRMRSAPPPSAASSTTRTAAKRGFMRRSCRRLPAALQQEHRQSEEDHEERHQRDVRDLGPEYERLGILAQVLAQLLQLDLRLQRLLLQVLDLRLLLGREDQRRLGGRAARLLQLLQPVDRLLALVLERLQAPEDRKSVV